MHVLLGGYAYSPHDWLPQQEVCLGAQGSAREDFNIIQQELSQLSTEFSNNVLDAAKSFKSLITDREGMAGLPDSALALAAQAAAAEDHDGASPEEGPWLFTLDLSSYKPVRTHAQNRCALPAKLHQHSVAGRVAGAFQCTAHF